MKPAMIIAILANIINAFANWVLIFGKLGFPELGIAGAAWATFSSRVFMAVVIMIYVMKNKKYKQYDVTFSFSWIGFSGNKKNTKLRFAKWIPIFF